MIKFEDLIQKFNSVIFDMDGVLIDSYEMHKESFNSVAKERYGFLLNDDEFKSIFGFTSEEGIRVIAKMKGRDVNELNGFVKETDAKFRETLSNSVLLIEGSIDFARKIKLYGLPIGIGTSAPKENANLFLKSLNIEDLFDVVVSGDEVLKGKPDPEIYLKAASLMNIEPHKCLVFEDSIMGITSAKKAGMYCIAIASTHGRNELLIADEIINNFHDIT